ncbi:YadA family autotransporter adhesin, partial [Burkholderia cenocepacia]|uniref:YadA family autotransporter adhesin n=1 Tax=Burkholderia cenocepacia TaxID=95486 RepID=UPI001B9F7B98|nr:adhesin [Burkholderia cenocepacia]
GSQLFATNENLGSLKDSLTEGGLIDPTTGKSLAVVYDSVAKDTVTLGGGKTGTTLSNVKAGTADLDAVNVKQMQQAVVSGNPYIGGRGTGTAAQATAVNALALGLGSVANQINTVSVGNAAAGLTRRVTNVQDGQANSDAATVGQVNDLVGTVSTRTQTAIDNMNSQLMSMRTLTLTGSDPYVKVDGEGDGSDNAVVGEGTYGVAVGAEASATGVTAIAVGPSATSSGTGSVALGAGAQATRDGAVALAGGNATGNNALALGNGTNALSNNSVALGFNASAAGTNALSLGNTAAAAGVDSVAMGTLARVDAAATNSLALGRKANVASAALNSVALGANSVADRINTISVGSLGQQRQITYVARGTADTDAVNVSQLKGVADALGGGSTVEENGKVKAPTYTLVDPADSSKKAGYHTVG